VELTATENTVLRVRHNRFRPVFPARGDAPLDLR